MAADPNRCSNPSTKVRLIGKIKDSVNGNSESLSQNSNSWIVVKNPEENGSSEKCKVFFETQSTSSRKDGYELDYCYGQHEEIDQIYSREIQPIILDVFDGRNASIIALGARGSGKTYTIQGSQEKPGIAVIAMSEILSKAKELGKSVSVSLYELTRDHVKDLLNPDHPTIQVLEDAKGKIIIKGLSQVSVNSITEFHDIYFTKGGSQSTQKSSTDQSHKGLMVHISSDDEKMKANLPIKINFVDLAGYQDLRRSGITPAESNRKNKSLYALLNVVSAINANEMRVPYRESILTRILQDSLGGRSHVLLLTCLNPSFCQDSLSTISLVSRSYQSTKQVLKDFTNRSQSSAKVKEISSLKNGKTVSASLSVKKQVDSRHLSTKKASSIIKGRKLFDEVKQANSKQLRCQSEDASMQKSKTLANLVAPLSSEEATQDASMQKSKTLANLVAPLSSEEATQDTSVAECCSSVQMEQVQDVNLEEPESLSVLKSENTLDLELTTMMKTDVSPHNGTHNYGGTSDLNIEEPESLSVLKSENTLDLELTTMMKTDVSPHNGTHNSGAGTCEENNLLHMEESGSPPLSLRIRELCNNLKTLCESTPTIIVPSDSQVYYNDTFEPKTPDTEFKIISHLTPRGGTFSNRSSRMKDSLVKDHLNFLNSANKEELKSLKHIGEKRATWILEMREESPEPFKTLDDLQDIGLSGKQIKDMMKQVAGGLFD
ncbi:hypothetical protein ACS0TY_004517 [Phlomoides rotata]